MVIVITIHDSLSLHAFLDPQLTARHGGGHVPAPIVMSRTLDFPEERKLWNVFDAYTIVATQRGACKDMQKKLASKGVEVVEFDFLNPKDVMEYCYDRGYLSLLWECGGSLSAPAIKSGVIHKVPFHLILSILEISISILIDCEIFRLVE